MKHGKGFFYWAEGSTYEGDFHNNIIQGKGTYKWCDGRKFIGDWYDNKMNGQSTLGVMAENMMESRKTMKSMDMVSSNDRMVDNSKAPGKMENNMERVFSLEQTKQRRGMNGLKEK